MTDATELANRAVGAIAEYRKSLAVQVFGGAF